MLNFFQPVWLLLLIPLAVAWWMWALPNRGLRALRALVFVLVVLAMAQLAIKLPDRAGTVVVVVDRSESMPPKAAAAQKETIDLLLKSMGPRDLLGVVSFGRQAVVERSPQRGEFSGFTAAVGPEHSHLNEAIEAALTVIPPEAGGRILVLSDGKWTGKDPRAAAARAAGRTIAIDHRLLARPQVNEIAIQSFLTPESALPGQAFVLSAWVQSPVDQEVQYQLRRGPTILASGTKPVLAGLTRLMFRDRATEAGVYEYTLTIEGPGEDPVPENNQARALVGIEGDRTTLVVSGAGEDSGLVKLLRSGGMSVLGRTPGQSHWSLEELSQHAAVLIENVSANQIGGSGLEVLAAWVEGTGSGLMLTGGQKAYGPGGYFKSPLDRILPLSMEMRREHRKLSLAIVVTLDRSGSMAAPVGGGRVKMDLANIGTAQVLDLLSPTDEFGVIAVDSSPHVIVPIDTVAKNLGQRGKILGIDSMGGGIFVYEALVAAARMLMDAQAQTKHIILFADAADAEEPGRYRELLEKCRDAGISVSVVGLGTEADVDADLLKDIAQLGGGTCYFTQNPDDIPRLFAQDTFTVARSTFVDEPSPFQFTAGFRLLGSPLTAAPPQLGGYNLCYLRPEANLAAVTTDEYAAPVVASWNAGHGRVLCFSGEADGKFSGDFAGWAQVGEFYNTLARWTAGKRQPLPDDLLITQQVRDGVCFVQLHLDPERQGERFTTLPRVTVLHGLPGAAPGKRIVPLQWKNADLLEAAIPITGRETILNTVEMGGFDPVALAPTCLPYSPEFAPGQADRGAATLAQLSLTTGGKERIELTNIWTDLPTKPRYVELTPWLLVLAVILFLLEVFERRTGWVTRLFQPRLAATAATADEQPGVATQPSPAAWLRLLRLPLRRHTASIGRRESAKAKLATAQKDSTTSAASKSSAPSIPDPALTALREARERAERRTRKDG
ncbi:MAG: VWA domain-containing protein [Verrucomicrobiae bacterium]|nr:VWA domain-containing protein [Verrucomicrobiae bacterium]